MTLAQIMKLALRQLDEDPEDISEYDELFRQYANIGYQIALREYYRPRDVLTLETDENAKAQTPRGIIRMLDLMDEKTRECVAYELSSTGRTITTGKPNASLIAVCEMEQPPLERDTDEPILPEHAQHALVDYICYRHLLCGNLAKQSRAQAYQQSFYQTLGMLRPQAAGSVTGLINLYTASDIRNTRW